MSDKYRMFKNFMYNDLGITKEDIKNWTKEAVKETALDYVTHKLPEIDTNDIKTYIRSVIRQEVRPLLKEIVKDELLLSLTKNMKITFVDKDNKNG